MRSLRTLVCAVSLAGCAGSPNTIEVELAPPVISSLDGTTTVRAIVADNTTPLDGIAVHVDIAYTDRNGTMHAIAPLDGKTDSRGVYEQAITGLTWDGTGTVTVSHGKATATADFEVLDRTPPKITILPPTTNNHVGPGLPLDVQVHVTDEIGVSQVTLDGTGGIDGGRTTVVASGAQDVTLTFHLQVPQQATPGPSIELHALASDLSGNLATAAAVTLTVDPAITIATPPGLAGSLLVDGNQTQLADPRAIAVSPKDGKLYVADHGGGACNQRCIWQVDPTSGTVATVPVYVGLGSIEGVAFDATGDNLYFTDRQNRTGQLAWNGTAYATLTACNDFTQPPPQDPFHLIFDETLGLVIADGNSQEVVQVATCAPTTQGANFTNNANLDAPRGIAEDPTGQIYVSDQNRGTVSRVDPTSHAVSAFASGFQEPYGLEWLGASTTPFANSLLVAEQGARTVTSTTGAAQLAAAYLRNTPIDLAVAGGTLYILTSASANNRGRIYKVTGF